MSPDPTGKPHVTIVFFFQDTGSRNPPRSNWTPWVQLLPQTELSGSTHELGKVNFERLFKVK